MTSLYDSTRRPVALGNELARGGQGVVLRVAGDSGVLAKLYVPAPGEGQEDKLRWMTGHPPADPGRASGHASIAWPIDLLYDPQRRFVGYLMPYVQDAVPILQVFNPRSRAAMLPAFDRHYLHRAARNLAGALGALHEHEYVVGDLNESNVLVTPSALVTLIDTDSFQVQEPAQGRIIVYPCPVGKLEYTAPELQGAHFDASMRRWEHDAFALGVLAFQLLMEGNHPFRARWLKPGEPPPLEARIKRGYFPYMAEKDGGDWPVEPAPGVPPLDILHPELVWLLRRCFVEGHAQPSRRPAAREWEKSLAAAEADLVACQNGHVFDRHSASCPICGGQARGARRATRAAPRSQQPVANAPRRTQAGRAGPAGPSSGGAYGAGRAGMPGAPAWLRLLWEMALVLAGAPGAPGSGPAAGSPGQPSSASERLFRWAAQRLVQAVQQGMGRNASSATVRSASAGGAAQAMPCPRCGWANHPEEIYCQRCAFPLAGTRPCPHCGRPMPRNTLFCTHCQARL